MTVLFDTAMLEPADRPDSWNDAHRRIFFPIGVWFTEADAPSGRIEQQELGPVRAFRVSSEPSVIERSVAEVRSFDPGDFLVGTLLSGRTGIEQAGRSGLLGPRDVSSWDSSRPFRVTHFEPFELLLLVVPDQLLGLRRTAMQARTASRLAQGTGLASLAATFFRDVWNVAERDPGCRRDDLADGVLSLVRALHGHETAERAPSRRLPGDLLLSQIRSFIERNLQDPSLGPDSIARAHFISTRYVHKLRPRRRLGVGLGAPSTARGMPQSSHGSHAGRADGGRGRTPLDVHESHALQPRLSRGLRLHTERLSSSRLRRSPTVRCGHRIVRCGD